MFEFSWTQPYITKTMLKTYSFQGTGPFCLTSLLALSTERNGMELELEIPAACRYDAASFYTFLLLPPLQCNLSCIRVSLSVMFQQHSLNRTAALNTFKTNSDGSKWRAFLVTTRKFYHWRWLWRHYDVWLSNGESRVNLFSVIHLSPSGSCLHLFHSNFNYVTSSGHPSARRNTWVHNLFSDKTQLGY